MRVDNFTYLCGNAVVSDDEVNSVDQVFSVKSCFKVDRTGVPMEELAKKVVEI